MLLATVDDWGPIILATIAAVVSIWRFAHERLGKSDERKNKERDDVIEILKRQVADVEAEQKNTNTKLDATNEELAKTKVLLIRSEMAHASCAAENAELRAEAVERDNAISELQLKVKKLEEGK